MKGSTIGKRFLFLLVIVGVVLTYMGAMDVIRGNQTPANFETLMASDVKKGLIVEGDVYANLGAFMESYTTTNGVKTGSSQYTYLIPVGEDEYMGLMNFGSEMQSQLDAQTDATFNILDGISTEPVTVHFKGRVLGMDSESKGYMSSYMRDMGFTENEITAYALSYYIKCENYDGGPVELGIGIVCLLIGAAVLLIPILSARKNQEVMYAHETPSAGTEFSNSAFGDLSSDPLDTFQEADAFNMDSYDSNTDSHVNTSGLGAGLADDYKSEQSKSGLSLKLKDD